jgi:choline monooxygenase
MTTSTEEQGSSMAPQALLDAIAEGAARPLAEAVSLPPAAYHSADLLARERETLFRHGWLCAGRVDEIPRPGDYLSFALAAQPVVSIRQPDGGIRTFANMCAHRGARLLGEHGNCQRIICPYHAWSYDLAGHLVGAPYMEQARGFSMRDVCLPEIRTEVWAGWLYVTLDDALPPVATELAGLAEELAMFEMERYVQILRRDEIWRTNWKALAENFMESYHLFQVHPQTVEPDMPTRTTVCVPGADAWCLHYFYGTPGSEFATAHPARTHVHGDDRRRNFDACVFPSHLFAGGHRFIFWLSLDPRAVDEVGVRWGVAVAPEVLAAAGDRDAYVAATPAAFEEVNREDRVLLERMQGACATPLARPGRLSHFERPLWEFQRFLARALTANGS